MVSSQSLSKKLTPSEKAYKFIKVWQIIELILLSFSIPATFGFSVIFTGDGDSVINFYQYYIFPALIFYFLLKITVTAAFFKKKQWAFTFNFIENFFLILLFLSEMIFIIIGIIFSESVSMFSDQAVTIIIYQLFFGALLWYLSKQYFILKKSDIFRR